MRLAKLFGENANIAETIVETNNNQLHKIDKLLFAYVNNPRPNSDAISVRVTEREHEILRVALKEKRR